ncbi:MAG: hypothetical protein V1817_04315 [Candidatus Micrarchaeota archaeon]
MSNLKLFFSEKARNGVLEAEASLQKLFVNHAEKLLNMPPRRHLRFGLPFNVEDVTKQARMIYRADGETLSVLRCFASHKDYERWFKSFK